MSENKLGICRHSQTLHTETAKCTEFHIVEFPRPVESAPAPEAERMRRADEFQRNYVCRNFDDWMSVEGHTESEFDSRMMAAFARAEVVRALEGAAQTCDNFGDSEGHHCAAAIRKQIAEVTGHDR